MDIATRFQARAKTFLEHEKAAMLDEQAQENDAAAAAAAARRRARPAQTDATGQFRKPSLPASATRHVSGHQRQTSGSFGSTNGVQRQPSLTNNTHKRRISGNIRVPSGPREYPGSPGKRTFQPMTSSPAIDATTPSRQRPTLLPSSTSEPFFNTSLSNANDLTRGSFGNPSDISEPSTPASQRKNSASLDFLPAINFDEFQTSLGTLDTGPTYRTDMLDNFPTIGGGRILRSDTARAKAQEDVSSKRSSLNGDQYRQRFLDRTSKGVQPTAKVHAPVRAQRQSTTQELAKLRTAPFGAATSAPQEDLTRSNSLLRTRRITMTAPQEKPRTKQQPARKSMLPTDPNTPTEKQISKNAGSQTPSSSGRRQSIASGRASGLGARTISPTDARRIKRMSIAPQQPPMPLNMKGPPTPGEEAASLMSAKSFEHTQHIAAPSPSLIPMRKDSSSLASNSARASPSDGGSATSKFGYPFPAITSTPALSSKSSYASLHNATTPGAGQSRVPVPKSRSAHSGNTTTNTNEESQQTNELIPPVPAIPKGYDSPKEVDKQEYLVSEDLPEHFGVPSEQPRRSFDSDRARHGGARKSILGRTGQKAATRDESFSTLPDQNGRQNNNLQPLRLPPLNLAMTRSDAANQFPRPSQELDDRDKNWSGVRTPEWSRGHKTPSTPMTASKATFFRRHGEGTMRSSTSHFGSRDAAFDSGTAWLEDDDSNGVPIPQQNFSRATGNSRSAITPFASGSLPKGSGEFTRPSGDYTDDAYFLGNSAGSYEGLRLARAKTYGQRPNIADTFGRSLSIDQVQISTDAENCSPAAEIPEANLKKEGGLRRKLSLGWRRSSSKAASRADNHNDSPRSAKDKGSMLPPRLPASAAFTGDGSLGISTSTRPSLEFGNTLQQSESLSSLKVEPPQSSVSKTRSLHSERPQPVSNLRSTSWSNLNRPASQKSLVTQPKPKHGHTPSTISSLIKDQDDLAADEEMRKLSQKKKDVDNVAKQTEELLQRASPKPQIDLEKILHDRHNSLNIFERGEVVEYEAEGIYFTGTKSAKKIVGSLHPSSNQADAKESDKAGKALNYGYDDERGDYNIICGDHLAYRYEVCDLLGKGSFGQVVRCIDHKDGGVVAVKIIRNKKRFHQQALVEVGILGKLREWDPEGAHATLSITGSFYFRSHLCIVTPCLSINLYELIRAHNFTGFPLPLIRRVARQLLSCLVLLQQKRVIHCDLKPENILLCSARAADVKVIDFGSSCREEEKVYTYIQSRFYRSPEVILGSSYGLGIDMWSLGCILAELWTGYPIFPGENEQDQLACIMEIFGPPDRHLVERCTRKKLFFDSVGKPRVTVSSKGRRRRPSSKTLQQALKTDDEPFIDFIARCLRWDPDRRLKPNDACSHPFITNQPLHSRPSIPDEARRAARVRSTAAIPALSTSPVKRINPSQGSIAATPQKTGISIRQVPDTPQTALKAPATSSVTQVSPAKLSASRRQSTAAAAGGAAALSSSRRQSSGAALAASMNLAMSKASGPSLAEKAARQSMAATMVAEPASGTGRWRV